MNLKKTAKMKHRRASTLALRSALGIILVSGCISPKQPQAPEPVAPPDAPEVIEASALYEQGNVQDAILATIDITRKNPGARGLGALQAKLAKRLAEERMAEAETRSASTISAASADAERFAIMPETYRAMRHVVGETGSLKSVPATMLQILNEPVSVNLQNANLNAFIAQFASATNINIVADSVLSPPEDAEGAPAPAITIKAENTPLIEILDYVGRNLGVTFSVGENIIWATVRDEKSETALPMETRVYRLRKGLTGSELGKSVQGLTPFKGAQSSRDTNRNETKEEQKQEAPEASVALLEIVTKFIPQPDGAELLYNDKAHVLIVKNTKENLSKAEELIDALDIRPLQILIEARFISTELTDLSDLGLDWLLDIRGPAQYGAPEGEGSVADGIWQRGHNKSTAIRPDVLTGISGGSGLGVSYQAVLGNTALQVTLNALKKDGKSRTLFVPRVTTLNNREATVRVGVDTTYYDDVDVQSTTSTGYGNSSGYHDVQMRYNTPSRLETGCTLLVTPSVGADLSTINLLLRPEISDVLEWKKYIISTTTYTDENEEKKFPTIEIPTVTRQYLETEAVVRSGETVVLGGLVRTHKKDEEVRTPWLSDLPLLGRLFRHTTETISTENILIFVTATLLSDTGEGLIPLNEIEHYGSAVQEDSRIPRILQPGASLQPPDALPNAPREPLPPEAPADQAAAPLKTESHP